MYNFDSFYAMITVLESEVLSVAAILNSPRDGVPNGSSFAVTSDAPPGRRNIHLSRVSTETLIKNGVLEDLTEKKP
jgi:hypothetical protein